MQEDVRESESNLFEVVLYFENESWAFSTSAYSTHSEAALEVAEKEFSVHARRHKLGNIRADFACVLDSGDDRYFSKRDGRWRIENDRSGWAPLVPGRRLPGAGENRQRAAAV